MSESTFPFEGSSVAVAPPEPPADAGTGSDNRTKLIALIGVAVLLVAGVLVYFFVLAGGDDASDDVATPPTASSEDTGAVVPQPAAQPKKQPKQRVSAKSFGRDPFKALVVEATESGGSTTTAGDTGSTPITGTSGATSDPVTGSSGSSSETTVPAASTAHRFKVVSVAPDNSTVTVKVDGEFYRNLKAGEIFAQYFKVRGIGGHLNAFQYGELLFTTSGTKAISVG